MSRRGVLTSCLSMPVARGKSRGFSSSSKSISGDPIGRLVGTGQMFRSCHPRGHECSARFASGVPHLFCPLQVVVCRWWLPGVVGDNPQDVKAPCVSTLRDGVRRSVIFEPQDSCALRFPPKDKWACTHTSIDTSIVICFVSVWVRIGPVCMRSMWLMRTMRYIYVM